MQPLLASISSFSHHVIGSHEWWCDVQQSGTPLVNTLDPQHSEVTFLWRDPNGAESAITHVYIDVYSHTPHPTQAQISLTRIPSTDVWYWQTQLANDWLGSYYLMPATADQSIPTELERGEIRQRWIQLMSVSAQADPLNLHPSHDNGNGIRLSPIALSQAIAPVFQTAEANADQTRLLASTWRSEQLGKVRRIWLYHTADDTDDAKPLPLVILLDGHYWATHLPLFGHLDQLTRQGDLPPAVYLFLDSINASERTEALACNASFWQALISELLPDIGLYYNLDECPHRHIVVGQSLGGLSALYAISHWPEVFASAICQSGSFWWPDVSSEPGTGALFQHIKQHTTPYPLQVMLEAGCYENDMLAQTQSMTKTLMEAGHHAHFQEFRGGHDWLCWREGLLRSLKKMLSLSIPESH